MGATFLHFEARGSNFVVGVLLFVGVGGGGANLYNMTYVVFSQKGVMYMKITQWLTWTHRPFLLESVQIQGSVMGLRL